MVSLGLCVAVLCRHVILHLLDTDLFCLCSPEQVSTTTSACLAYTV